MPRQRHPDTGPLRGVPESVSRSLWRTAAWTGGGAAAAGAVLGAGVGVACWLPGAGTSGHPLSAVRAGLLGFLAAQHAGLTVDGEPRIDRKSTRLNSSHITTSYAVFCSQKK